MHLWTHHVEVSLRDHEVGVGVAAIFTFFCLTILYLPILSEHPLLIVDYAFISGTILMLLQGLSANFLFVSILFILLWVLPVVLLLAFLLVVVEIYFAGGDGRGLRFLLKHVGLRSRLLS